MYAKRERDPNSGSYRGPPPEAGRWRSLLHHAEGHDQTSPPPDMEPNPPV